jgi:hypothetical protein
MTGSAFAQNSATSSSAVLGTVQVPITIVNNEDLNFGTNMLRGIPSSIPANSYDAAEFFITGDAGDNVFFNIDPTVLLTLEAYPAQDLAGVVPAGGQATTMSVTTNSRIRYVDDAPSALVMAPVLHALSVPGTEPGDGVIGSGTGQMYLFVGGSVTPGPDQQRGSYAGTVNVSVQYQ